MVRGLLRDSEGSLIKKADAGYYRLIAHGVYARERTKPTPKNSADEIGLASYGVFLQDDYYCMGSDN